MIEIDECRQEILDSDKDLLVVGGAGSGKTTIALLKAKKIIENKEIDKWQRVLFLSFANATVNRVKLAGAKIIDRLYMDQINIATYHSFEWEVIKAHGYLIYGHQLLLLDPDLRNRYIKSDRDGDNNLLQLIEDSGLIDFDMFAKVCMDIFTHHPDILKAYCTAYPIIIVDEFQDTNEDEWLLIQELHRYSKIIALGDTEQRIYEFRGASPNRIKEFYNAITPDYFDLQDENNRSRGTDILKYGNDLLLGNNLKCDYSDVDVCMYDPYIYNLKDHVYLKFILLKRITELHTEHGEDWSVAILTPANKIMLEVSESLNIKGPGKLPAISHNIIFNAAPVNLAAKVLASTLEGIGKNNYTKICLDVFVDYLFGRKPNGPNDTERKMADAFMKYIDTDYIRGSKRELILSEFDNILRKENTLRLTGNPRIDWRFLINIFNKSEIDLFNDIARHAELFSLLKRGTKLYENVLNDWNDNGIYTNTIKFFTEAIEIEAFSAIHSPQLGVNLMTIHRAKGKEFDEVILYEGVYDGKFQTKSDAQSLVNLRVGVTRAREHVTILTPKMSPCRLICP